MKREHSTIAKSFKKVRKDLAELWRKAHLGNWGEKRRIARLKIYDELYRHLFPDKNYALVNCLMMAYGVWLEKSHCSKETISKKLGITPYRAKSSKKIALRLLGMYEND